MNKKTVLVFILAGILAMLGAYAIFKINQPKHINQIQQEEKIIPVKEPEPVKIIEEKPVEQKPVSVQPVKKVSYKKPAPKTNISELPVMKPIVIQEAVPEPEPPIQNEGVVQEENSNDIVITKEYKMQSPARYTFK